MFDPHPTFCYGQENSEVVVRFGVAGWLEGLFEVRDWHPPTCPYGQRGAELLFPASGYSVDGQGLLVMCDGLIQPPNLPRAKPKFVVGSSIAKG